MHSTRPSHAFHSGGRRARGKENAGMIEKWIFEILLAIVAIYFIAMGSWKSIELGQWVGDHLKVEWVQ